MVQQLSTNTFGVAKWIVSATASDGTHTTISAALTSASSGDTIFVRPGTYTENLTLKAGVNIVAFDQDAFTPNVTIIGKATFTAAGTVTLANLRLQTNSDFFLAVTGSAASVVLLDRCYLNCSNNTGISFTSSSSSAAITINNCSGNIGTTGISLFASSSAGFLDITLTNIANSGASTTASTISAGSVEINNCVLAFPITTSSTAAIIILGLQIAATNTTCLTINGTTASQAEYMVLNSGTASGISIGAGASMTINNCRVTSSNTNAITGAGTLIYSNIIFTTSSVINTTTQTAEYTNLGKWKASGQPAFFAYQASVATNVTGDGSNYTLGSTVDLTEVFDQDSNFDPTTGTFTAPVTGRYYLSASALVTGGTAITGPTDYILVTSNRNIRNRMNFGAAAAVTNYSNPISILCDMDAADTCTVVVATTDTGGKIDDIYGDADSWTFFSGFLAC